MAETRLDRRISLCMIARNEEATIERCLASARPFVDEVIVVDTGSSDKTPKLAAAAGARVFHVDWCDDFATARNEALCHATGDWVLSLDADEILEASTGAQIRQLVASATDRPTVFSVMIRNFLDDDDGARVFVSFGQRLFPRDPKIHWIRRIHEQVTHADGDERLDFALTDHVVITHGGYLKQTWNARHKAARNVELLQRMVDDDPDDAFSLYCLGQEAYTAKEFGPALGHFERTLEISRARTPGAQFMAYTYALAVGACIETRNLRRGVELGEEGAQTFNYPDLYCNLASCYFLVGDIARATSYFERARSLAGVRSPFGGEAACTTWRPLQGLGDVYSSAGDVPRALDYYTAAVALEPERTYPAIRAAYLCLSLGRLDEARQRLAKVLESRPENEGARIAEIDVLVAIGKIDDVGQQAAALVNQHPESVPYRAKLADLYLSVGQLSEASRLIEDGLIHDGPHALLYQKSGIVLTRSRKWKGAEAAFTNAVNLNPNDLRSRVGREVARVLDTFESFARAAP